MDRLGNYYEKIESRYTAEELSERVMDMENNKVTVKKRSPKRIAAMAACFAVVAASTVAVGAATDWKYAEAFTRLFGEKADNLSEYVPEKEEVIENTFTLVDFSVEAAAVSNNGMYLMISAEAKNGAVFDEEFSYRINFFCDSSQYRGNSMKIENVERTPEKVKILIAINANLCGGNITFGISDCSVEEGAVWEVKFSSPDIIDEIKKDFETETVIGLPVEAFGSYGQLIQRDSELRAINITVSSIDAVISGVYELGSYAFVNREKIWVEMKSGDKVPIFSVGSNGTNYKEKEGYSLVGGNMYLSFAEPIDINELSAIVFDDERIEF